MKYDFAKDLSPIGHGGFGCAHCGTSLKATDLALDCPDCAAIFCETCVRNGTFENHRCEDYDWGDDEED